MRDVSTHERFVLGAAILDDDALVNVVDDLNEDHFTSGEHREIFRTLATMFAEDAAIDLMTLTAEIPKHAASLTEMTTRVGSVTDVSRSIRFIREHYIARTAQRTMQQAMNDLEKDEVFDARHRTGHVVGHRHRLE